MMPTTMLPRHLLPVFALLAMAPGSAAATCAGARSNLAFIQQTMGAIRAEARAGAVSGNEASERARQELARWAAVLPRAEQDVANECAAAPAAPPQIATPVMTPPPGSQPTRATPAQTVARPTAPPGAASPPATVAVRVPSAPADPRAGERSVQSKLNPARSIAAAALTMSAAHPAHPHTTSGAAPDQGRMHSESHATQQQTSLRLTTGTAVRKGTTGITAAKQKARAAAGKQDVTDTAAQQSFARPIFKAKSSQ